MGRSPCCAKEGLNRGAWTAQEDNILREYVRIHGEGKWRILPKRAGLKRCGKSCRLRWLKYLRPDIKRGNISPEEEELIIRLHKLLGNRWSLIAGRLPGRTDNEIKNYWNTNLGKRIQSRQSAAPTFKLPGNSDGNDGVPKVNQAPKIVPSSPPGNTNPYVIRTKAFRCSKVLISPQPNKCDNLETRKGPEHPMEDGLYPTNHPVNYSSSEELLSFPTGEDNPSSDFMMNFNMGDMCLSTILNSDFPDICGFNGNEDISNDPSPSPEQPLMFSEEMLQDWTPGGCIEINEGPNLQSFSSLLDSGSEWLVE